MKLAKPALDAGLQLCAGSSEALAAVLDCWREQIGAVPDHVLPLGGGRRQHRHGWGESVIKINETRGGLPPSPASGWRSLLLAGPDIRHAETIRDPEGNVVERRHAAAIGLGVRLHVRAPETSARFFAQLGLPVEDLRVRIGESTLELVEDRDALLDPPLDGTGLRYVTIQVHGADSSYAEALAAGAREGMAPRTLGDVARFGFVREPGGNWIELSQRRSIVGSLDPA